MKISLLCLLAMASSANVANAGEVIKEVTGLLPLATQICSIPQTVPASGAVSKWAKFINELTIEGEYYPANDVISSELLRWKYFKSLKFTLDEMQETFRSQKSDDGSKWLVNLDLLEAILRKKAEQGMNEVALAPGLAFYLSVLSGDDELGLMEEFSSVKDLAVEKPTEGLIGAHAPDVVVSHVDFAVGEREPESISMDREFKFPEFPINQSGADFDLPAKWTKHKRAKESSGQGRGTKRKLRFQVDFSSHEETKEHRDDGENQVSRETLHDSSRIVFSESDSAPKMHLLAIVAERAESDEKSAGPEKSNEKSNEESDEETEQEVEKSKGSKKRKQSSSKKEGKQKRKRASSQGEGKHKCQDCGKTFRFPSELKKHSKVHGNEVFTCECERIFKSEDSLKRHKRNGCDPNAPRPFKCEKCRKVAYPDQSSLNFHKGRCTGQSEEGNQEETKERKEGGAFKDIKKTYAYELENPTKREKFFVDNGLMVQEEYDKIFKTKEALISGKKQTDYEKFNKLIETKRGEVGKTIGENGLKLLEDVCEKMQNRAKSSIEYQAKSKQGKKTINLETWLGTKREKRTVIPTCTKVRTHLPTRWEYFMDILGFEPSDLRLIFDTIPSPYPNNPQKIIDEKKLRECLDEKKDTKTEKEMEPGESFYRWVLRQREGNKIQRKKQKETKKKKKRKKFQESSDEASADEANEASESDEDREN